MDAVWIDRIESGAARGASVLLGAAVFYAAFCVTTAVGIPLPFLCAGASGIGAVLACGRVLDKLGEVRPAFPLPAFTPTAVDFPDLLEVLQLTTADIVNPGELVLGESDRFVGDEALLLDDVLADVSADSRVVHLFDRRAMTSLAELQSDIGRHIDASCPVSAPADAAQALSHALAELRRSLG